MFYKILLCACCLICRSGINAQSKWHTRLSLGAGPSYMVIAMKENPYINNRTTISVQNAFGHHQRFTAHFSKKSSKAFALLGLQHNVNKIKINYLKFDNPLIKEGRASQVFDLRYFSVPMGLGRRMKTGKKSELSMSLLSEIMATYRLRCVDSSIFIKFNDNSTDNLASIKSMYSYYSYIFGSLGLNVEFSKNINNTSSFFVSVVTNWQPRSTQWIDYGASIFAGGQLEQIRIIRGVWRNSLTLGMAITL